VEIRVRDTLDLPPLVAALTEVAAADGYPTTWPDDPAGWLTSKAPLAAWVAEASGAVVGHVVLAYPRGEMPVRLWSAATGLDPDRCAVVKRLFVVPAARGRGLGRALLAVATAEAARRSLHPVLDVVDLNRSAVRLYERLNWVRFGTYEMTGELLHCFAAPGVPVTLCEGH
jgi:GNAT superfamily N-acetyltransferase